MKKAFFLSLIAVGLVGCYTADRTPYMGSVGDYGFTYDLNNTPSPFVDTSYRPLTAFDLAAPIIVVVTNRPPSTIVYQAEPEIGKTRFSGATPARAFVPGAAGLQFNEAAGAEPGPTSQAGGSTATQPAQTETPDRNYFNAGGAAFSPDDGSTNVSVQITNTNVNANVVGTNTVPNPATNQPNFAATNNVIKDAAGTKRTNQVVPSQSNTNAPASPNNPPPAPEPPVPPAPSPAPQSGNLNQGQP